MPREKKITIHEFDELSERAKDKARDWYRRGSQDEEWWENVYEDASRMGLKIRSFDIDRGGEIKGDFTKGSEICAERILKEHGPDTDSHALAEAFLTDLKSLRDNLENAERLADDDDGNGGDDSLDDTSPRDLEDQISDLEDGFRHDILEEYLSLLQKELEYLMSDEVVDENIRANGYTFNTDGRRE
jgi:hypothetical protein